MHHLQTWPWLSPSPLLDSWLVLLVGDLWGKMWAPGASLTEKEMTMSISGEVQDPEARPLAGGKGTATSHSWARALQLWVARGPLLRSHPTHGDRGEPGTIPEVAILRLRKKKPDNFLLFPWVYLIIWLPVGCCSLPAFDKGFISHASHLKPWTTG